MNYFKKSLILLGVVGSLTACASTDTASNSSSKQTGQTFENYGREVVVTDVPEAVLTLGPNNSELFVALGLEDKVVGNSLDNHSRGPLPEFAEGYAKIPELTYGPATREAVLTSGADFIYGIDWEFGEEALDINELEESGITVYLNGAKTIDQAFQEMTDIGTIFEVSDVAETFIQDQKERLAAVEDSVTSDPVKVLVYDSGESGVFTASQSNFETRLIEAAGGVNIFSDLTEKDWVTVSTEEILKRDPDVIIVHDYDAPSADEKIATIKADPVLSQLEAVKNERFVTISLESALPGPRIAYTVEKLAAGFAQ